MRSIEGVEVVLPLTPLLDGLDEGEEAGTVPFPAAVLRSAAAFLQGGPLACEPEMLVDALLLGAFMLSEPLWTEVR